MVVTGGGAGIGRALARGLAAAGARVVVNDLDAAAARRWPSRPAATPRPATRQPSRACATLIAAAREHLGEIDIYCSNAGSRPAPARTPRNRPGSGPGRST